MRLNRRGRRGMMTLDIVKLERKKEKLERRAQAVVGTLMGVTDLINHLKKLRETIPTNENPNPVVDPAVIAEAITTVPTEVKEEVPNVPTEG